MADSPDPRQAEAGEARQAAAARAREYDDPHENRMPIPRYVLAMVAALVAWGAYYIVTAPIDQPPALGDQRTVADLHGTPRAAGASVDGAALFQSHCVACHQASGQGLPGVFPPLAGSEWVTGSDARAAKIVLRGVTGKLTVKGTAYNGAMPAFAAQLGDAEIAAVLSHVRSQWGNTAPAVTPETVAAARAETAAMQAPFDGDAALGAPGG
ncbi:c-type cytochrome [Cupriavidus agavae]|uniref:Cbb3-type cytochrome c oxidase subunit III n=1 Tax=Cupriavidus agavae TaxID=1001822 RepID=A0A4Q7S9Q0_9BURK|nr:cytochrome c [Cupriavidus agavae]RZT42202.1 cbb3-type cytochrome c oxidase subunit III [Cupriavidus agavae]